MASSVALLLPTAAAAALLLLSLLFPVAEARPGVHFHPCKTLFISYTFSSSSNDPTLDLPQIATTDPKPFTSFTVFRIVRPLRPYYYSSTSIRHPIQFDRPREAEAEPAIGVSSLQERAKDILFVVVGLLFGVGCGALTGATIYLAWSLITNRYDGYSDGEEDAVDESPKKMGYVMIADPAPAVKEGYEGN